MDDSRISPATPRINDGSLDTQPKTADDHKELLLSCDDGAKAFSERLQAIMAERERKLEEIRSRVCDMQTKGDSALVTAQNTLLEVHSRMKKMVADLDLPDAVSLHRWQDKISEVAVSKPEVEEPSLGGRDPTVEVDSLYKHMLMAFRNWKPDGETSLSKATPEVQPSCLPKDEGKQESGTGS